MSNSRDDQTISSALEGPAPKDGASRRDVLLVGSVWIFPETQESP